METNLETARKTLQAQYSAFNWPDKEAILTTLRGDLPVRLPAPKEARTRSECESIIDAAAKEITGKKAEADSLISALRDLDYNGNNEWLDNLYKTKRALRDIEKVSIDIIDRTTTDVNSRVELANYDAFVFINLDYVVNDNGAAPDKARGLGVGIRNKQVTNRGYVPVASVTSRPANWDKCITVRTYPLSHNPAKRYIEITIERPKAYFPPVPGKPGLVEETDYLTLFNSRGVPDIPEFSYITLNSKIQIAGHGSFSSNTVSSDRKDKTEKKGFRMPIEAICLLISSNIKKYSKAKFDTWLTPLKLESQSCQAGGLDGVAELQVNGVTIERIYKENGIEKREAFSIENTMAGRFLTYLQQQGIWANIKARTTSSHSVKTQARSKPWDKTAFPDSYDRPDLGNSSYRGAGQNHRANAVFSKAQANISQDTYNQSSRFVSKMTFQGKDARMHGLKRFFYLDSSGAMQCKDLSNDADVDLFFEANKDRTLLYIYYNLNRVNNSWVGGGVIAAKRNKLFDLCFSIEAAPSYPELVAAIRNMAADPDVAANRNAISGLFGKTTQTVTNLTNLANMLNRVSTEPVGPKRLIPMPDPRRSDLGLS